MNEQKPPYSEHYQKMAIDPMTVIIANDYDGLRSFALKHLMRAGYKEGVTVLQDLRKAKAYIEALIEVEEGKSE